MSEEKQAQVVEDMSVLKVYTASSWRNPRYGEVVKEIKAQGFDVYDFQNPWDKGATFNWGQIDHNWEKWSMEDFVRALRDPIARRGFDSDFAGMKWADVCVLILPCGRSAHMEAGYFAGKGKPVHILLDGERPELTYSLGKCWTNTKALIGGLYHDEAKKRTAINPETKPKPSTGADPQR